MFRKSLGVQRRLHVYTPPGYERETTKKFPVLYLVHGFSDNDAAWSVHGKANWILDNLIADGKALPMIVVMPDGHALAPESRRADYGAANNAAFEHELVEDVIPMIESTYRAQADAGHRALAGLSMGGGHTLYTGLRHLDKFTWLGTFSAGIPGRDNNADGLLDPQAINHALKLFWLGCGKSDSLHGPKSEAPRIAHGEGNPAHLGGERRRPRVARLAQLSDPIFRTDFSRRVRRALRCGGERSNAPRVNDAAFRLPGR